MTLPLPRVVSDVGPGGPLVTAMGGINALANNMHLRDINRVKAQYAPLTTQAEAASKLAYARLMAPQFIAKAMNNPDFMGNLSDEQKNALRDLVYGAGASNPMVNANAQNPMQPSTMGIGQQAGNAVSDLISGSINHLKGLFGGQQQPAQNAMNMPRNYANPQQQGQGLPMQGQGVPDEGVGGQDVIQDPEAFKAYQWWLQTPQGQAEMKKGVNANIPDEEEIKQLRRANDKSMQLEVNTGQKTPQKSYAQKGAEYRGILKQGEELGKITAQDIGDVGHELKQLDATGNNIDRLIDDFTNPDIMELREQFPYLQDTQLKVLAGSENEKVRYLIGNLMSDIEAFKGSTINSFKGQTLKREFDYADKLKPSENDTVYTALGKLQTLKTLKDIAYKKNLLIKDYMKEPNMTLGDAIERANKEIDIKAVDKAAKEFTQPLYKIKNKKTNHTIMVPKQRAIELGVIGANNV